MGRGCSESLHSGNIGCGRRTGEPVQSAGYPVVRTAGPQREQAARKAWSSVPTNSGMRDRERHWGGSVVRSLPQRASPGPILALSSADADLALGHRLASEGGAADGDGLAAGQVCPGPVRVVGRYSRLCAVSERRATLNSSWLSYLPAPEPAIPPHRWQRGADSRLSVFASTACACRRWSETWGDQHS